MKKKFSLTTICFYISIVSGAQDAIKKYVQENTVEIKTIEPDSTNYFDLEVFGNAIGDAKIVMLGEQDHGGAATFLAKSRLVQYLHEKKGFNVLAFESDFFALNYGPDPVKNITPFWSYCKATKKLLFNYIPASLKTNNPLLLTGFDNQIGTKKLFPVLDSIIGIAPISEYWSKINTDTTANTIVHNRLVEIKSQLLKTRPATDFWIIVIDNLIIQTSEYRNLPKGNPKDPNVRDKQMAANLDWLNKIKYPHEKIIVWAHSYHISKHAGHYPDDFMNLAMPMASVFTADTANFNSTYVLGFTSYEGTGGRLFQKKYTLDKPNKNSFENWINKSFNYAFTDFKQYNTTQPNSPENFYLSGAVKGNQFHKSDKAQWNKIFDGVFYIKTMYSCLD